ncbi:MAG: AI-2E family transporter [Bacillota bacterium]
MKIEKNHNYLTIAIYVFITALAIIISYLILSNLTGFGENFLNFLKVFTPFIWGISIAYVLNPLMKWTEHQLSRINPLSKRKKAKRTIAVILTMLLFLVMLYEFFSLVIPTVSKSIGSLLGNLTYYYNNLETTIYTFAATYLGGFDLSSAQINSFVSSLISEVDKVGDLVAEFIPKSFSMAISLTGKLTNIVIAFIVSIYFLASKETFLAQIKKILYAFTNTAKSQYTLNLADKTNKIFNGYVSGSLLDALIIGFLCFAVLSLLKIEYAALISLLVGVTNIIPFFGPFIGAIPSALLLLMVSPKQCLIFIIIILVIQQLDGNVIKPKILGQTTGLASFWVIFAVSVSGSLFGILGMFVGVPVFAVIYTIFKEIVENRLRKKSLSPDTIDYREDLDDKFPVPNRVNKNKKAKTTKKDKDENRGQAESPENQEKNTPDESKQTNPEDK